MKRFKLPPLFALIISMQMIFTPYAGAQSAMQILDMGTQAVGMLMGAGQQGPSPQTQAQLALLKQQAKPVPDKYFNQLSLSKIPGLVPYLTKNGIPFPVLECPQLPAKPAKVKAAVCTEGLSGDANNPMALQSQMFEANAYKEAYTFLEEEYDSYLTTATSATKKQGVGCMDEARQVLSGFFQYRMNELDSLVNKLEAINKQFEEASKADLNAIEEITALLEGGSDLYNEVKSRSNNPELFDFSKKFQDPACSAMFTSERFNETGLDRGFNGISKLLKQTYEQPANGAQYSAQSFPQASAVVKQKIKKLAIDLEAQSKLGWRDLVSGRKDLSSMTKATGTEFNPSASLFADLQTEFSTKLDQLQARTVNVIREFNAAGINPKDAVDQIAERNPETFKSQMANMKVKVMNKCISDQMANVDTMLARIEDRDGSSKFAQRNSPNVLKARIKAILENDSISADQKIAQIQASEKEFSRYYLQMDRKIDDFSAGNGKPVSTKVDSVSGYLTVIKNNCNYNSENVKLENKSAAQALSEMNSINQEYQSLATNLGTDLRRSVESKMLDCSDNTSGATAGSCTPGVFNNRDSNFCARVADVCAGKMRACTEQTKQFVAAQKVQRDARKKSYNTQMKMNKDKVIALFDTTMAQYKLEADAMNSQFGIGFTPPTGILREVPEGQRYLGKLAQATNGSEDGTLLLEDPKQFVKMFSANVDKLKASVKAQQDGIMGNGGNGGILGKHIETAKANMQNAKREMQTMARDCDRKMAEAKRQYEENQRRMAEEAKKKNEELGEKRQELCNMYSMAQTNPMALCNGEFDDIASLPEAANLRAVSAAGCRRLGSSSPDNDSSDLRKAVRICRQNPVPEYAKNECDRFNQCENADQRPVITESEDGKTLTRQTEEDCKAAKATYVIVALEDSNDPEANEDTARFQEELGDAPAYCAAADNSDRFSNPFEFGSGGSNIAGNGAIGF